MALNGVKTTSISNVVALADEVIVNRSGSTGLIPVDDLAAQLAAAGPLATALIAASTGLVRAATQAALNAIPGTRVGQPGEALTGAGKGAYSWSGAAWVKVGDLIDTASLTASIDSKADQEDVDTLTGEVLTDEVYAEGTTDDDGRFLIGYRHDGTVDVLDSYPLLDAEFVYAVVDEDMRILWGIRYDGTFYAALDGDDAVGGTLLTMVRGGDIYIDTGVRRARLTIDGMNDSPEVSSNDRFVSYVHDTGARLEARTEEVLAATSLSATVTAIAHYVIFGQSLSIGASSGAPIHGAAVRAGRAVMYNAGVRVFGGADPALPVVAVNLYAWSDLRETDVETPGSGLGYGVTAAGRLPATTAALVSATGKGGQTYNNLKKGTALYNNLLETVRRARVMAAINGLDYAVRAVPFIHGEADHLLSKAVYRGYLIELQADLTTDLNALTGGAGDVLLCVDQLSSWTDYNDPYSEVPFAQLQAALDFPAKIICVGPKYHLPSSDGTHLTAASYARLGSYHARAIEQHKGGTPWLPLYCTGYSRAGAVITLHMYVPVGPLVIDTVAVTDPGNKGIVWTQIGGTARTISSVAVSGADIIVTLTGDPGSFSSASIGIAYPGTAGTEAGPTTGPRACIRDSASDVDIDGVAMPNWACHQLITIA